MGEATGVQGSELWVSESYELLWPRGSEANSKLLVHNSCAGLLVYVERKITTCRILPSHMETHDWERSRVLSTE